MSFTAANPYKLKYVQLFRYNDNGEPIGDLDPDNLTPGETGHAYFVTGVTGVEFDDSEMDEIEFYDGSEYQGSVDGGIIKAGNATLTLNTIDANLNELLFGVNVDTTDITNVTASSYGFTKDVTYQIGAILSSFAHVRKPVASLGKIKWHCVFIPKCTARITKVPSMNQEAGRNPVTYTLRLSIQKTSMNEQGIAYGTNQGFGGNKEFITWKNADAPFALTSFVEDGAATGYTTAYLPTTSEVTSGKTTHRFVQDGVVTAPTSFSTSTGDVVITPGSSGDIASVLYQTNFVTA